MAKRIPSARELFERWLETSRSKEDQEHLYLEAYQVLVEVREEGISLSDLTNDLALMHNLRANARRYQHADAKLVANIDVAIPKLLDTMIKQVMPPGEGDHQYLAYVGGWITGAAKRQYRRLIHRDGLPRGQKMVGLLCELAVMRALVEWHEVRDRPPPMPSIRQL